MTGTRSLFTLVRNCFGLVTGSCDRTQGNNSFVRNPPGDIAPVSFMEHTMEHGDLSLLSFIGKPFHSLAIIKIKLNGKSNKMYSML